MSNDNTNARIKNVLNTLTTTLVDVRTKGTKYITELLTNNNDSEPETDSLDSNLSRVEERDDTSSGVEERDDTSTILSILKPIADNSNKGTLYSNVGTTKIKHRISYLIQVHGIWIPTETNNKFNLPYFIYYEGPYTIRDSASGVFELPITNKSHGLCIQIDTTNIRLINIPNATKINKNNINEYVVKLWNLNNFDYETKDDIRKVIHNIISPPTQTNPVVTNTPTKPLNSTEKNDSTSNRSNSVTVKSSTGEVVSAKRKSNLPPTSVTPTSVTPTSVTPTPVTPTPVTPTPVASTKTSWGVIRAVLFALTAGYVTFYFFTINIQESLLIAIPILFIFFHPNRLSILRNILKLLGWIILIILLFALLIWVASPSK